MKGYYRSQAYLVRGILLLWWLFAFVIPFSWYVSDTPFPRYWWALHLLGIPMTALFWFVTSIILRSTEKS